MTARDRLLALVVPIVWGLNFVVIDEGLGDDMPPLLFLAIRFVFVAFPLVVFVPRPDLPWRTVAAVGVFMSFGQFSLLYLALDLGMPAGLASLVLQAQVMITILLAWVFLGERATPAQLVGVGIGAAGLLIVAVAHGARAEILPLLVTIGAATSWAVGNTITRAAKVSSGLSLVVWSALVVPVPCVLLALAFNGPTAVGDALAGFDGVAIASTAYTVIGASLVGYSIFNGLLARYPAADVVPFILLVPPVGIASAWLVQGEVPTALEAVGAVVMMGGVALAVLGGRRTPTVVSDLAVLPDGRPLLDERGHAFLLVGRREHRVEDAPLEAQALAERDLLRAVHRLLDHLRARLAHGGDRRGSRERVVQQVGGRDDAGDEPGTLRLLGAHVATREAQLHRLRLPDGAREALRAAHAGHHAELDLRLAEDGGVGGDEDVAHHRELATTAQRVAGDRGDERRADALERLPASEPVGRVHVEVRLLSHLLDVCPGGERAVRAGEDDRADAGVDVELGKERGELLHHLEGERVQRLRAVQRDERDAVTPLDEDRLALRRRHACASAEAAALMPERSAICR